MSTTTTFSFNNVARVDGRVVKRVQPLDVKLDFFPFDARRRNEPTPARLAIEWRYFRLRAAGRLPRPTTVTLKALRKSWRKR